MRNVSKKAECRRFAAAFSRFG